MPGKTDMSQPYLHLRWNHMLLIFGLLLMGAATGFGQETAGRIEAGKDTFSIKDPDFNIPIIPSNTGKPKTDDPLESLHVRQWSNEAFDVGEHLVFDIMYGIIKAGTATMSIPDTQWVEGRPCFHIVTTAESSPFFSTFFKVEDRLESWMDTQGLFPWRHEKHIREGKYRADRYVTPQHRPCGVSFQ